MPNIAATRYPSAGLVDTTPRAPAPTSGGTTTVVPVPKPAYFSQDEGTIGPAPAAPVASAAAPGQPADTFAPTGMTISTVNADGSVSTVPASGPVPGWVWLVGAGLVLWLLMGKRSR